MLISFIVIMIAERFVSRADTKAVDQKSLASVNKKQNFFSDSQLGFQRTTTARSMTIKLQTMKTSDLDMQDDAS